MIKLRVMVKGLINTIDKYLKTIKKTESVLAKLIKLVLRIYNFFKNKRKLFLFLIILSIAAFFGYRTFKARSKKEVYKTALVKKQDIVQTVSASGKVKAEDEATVKFQTSGKLTWVGVKKGDRVKQWQTIASLDVRELERDLKKELLDYMNERWDYEQTTLDDYRDMAVTETIRRAKEQAQFDLDITILDVEIADIALEYATIYSPINGIVTTAEAPHPGVNVTPLTAEFIISNPDTLIFSANVDEVDIGKIKKGQKATIILDAYPEEEFIADVEHIEFTSSTTTGGGTAFAVKFKLPINTLDEKFKLGMNGEVDIVIEKKQDVLTIPFEAVKGDEEGSFVYILKDNKPEKIYIKPGFSNDIETQILDGLLEGDSIIVSGVNNFRR